jgi:hypothetical protein
LGGKGKGGKSMKDSEENALLLDCEFNCDSSFDSCERECETLLGPSSSPAVAPTATSEPSTLEPSESLAPSFSLTTLPSVSPSVAPSRSPSSSPSVSTSPSLSLAPTETIEISFIVIEADLLDTCGLSNALAGFVDVIDDYIEVLDILEDIGEAGRWVDRLRNFTQIPTTFGLIRYNGLIIEQCFRQKIITWLTGIEFPDFIACRDRGLLARYLDIFQANEGLIKQGLNRLKVFVPKLVPVADSILGFLTQTTKFVNTSYPFVHGIYGVDLKYISKLDSFIPDFQSTAEEGLTLLKTVRQFAIDAQQIEDPTGACVSRRRRLSATYKAQALGLPGIEILDPEICTILPEIRSFPAIPILPNVDFLGTAINYTTAVLEGAIDVVSNFLDDTKRTLCCETPDSVFDAVEFFKDAGAVASCWTRGISEGFTDKITDALMIPFKDFISAVLDVSGFLDVLQFSPCNFEYPTDVKFSKGTDGNYYIELTGFKKATLEQILRYDFTDRLNTTDDAIDFEQIGQTIKNDCKDAVGNLFEDGGSCKDLYQGNGATDEPCCWA